MFARNSVNRIDIVAVFILSFILGVYVFELLFILPLLYGSGYENWDKLKHICGGKSNCFKTNTSIRGECGSYHLVIAYNTEHNTMGELTPLDFYT